MSRLMALVRRNKADAKSKPKRSVARDETFREDSPAKGQLHSFGEIDDVLGPWDGPEGVKVWLLHFPAGDRGAWWGVHRYRAGAWFKVTGVVRMCFDHDVIECIPEPVLKSALS